MIAKDIWKKLHCCTGYSIKFYANNLEKKILTLESLFLSQSKILCCSSAFVFCCKGPGWFPWTDSTFAIPPQYLKYTNTCFVLDLKETYVIYYVQVESDHKASMCYEVDCVCNWDYFSSRCNHWCNCQNADESSIDECLTAIYNFTWKVNHYMDSNKMGHWQWIFMLGHWCNIWPSIEQVDGTIGTTSLILFIFAFSLSSN